MQKRFAIGDSEGPNLANLQLNFWRLAIERFDQIRRKWEECAVEDEEALADYTQDEFVIDAAIALVLAGTSISELLGQNVPSIGVTTPHIREAFETLIGAPLSPEVQGFFKIYDSLRHFGPAKHQVVGAITEDDLCEHLTTAQGIWVSALTAQGEMVGPVFQNTFAFGASSEL